MAPPPPAPIPTPPLPPRPATSEKEKDGRDRKKSSLLAEPPRPGVPPVAEPPGVAVLIPPTLPPREAAPEAEALSISSAALAAAAVLLLVSRLLDFAADLDLVVAVAVVLSFFRRLPPLLLFPGGRGRIRELRAPPLVVVHVAIAALAIDAARRFRPDDAGAGGPLLLVPLPPVVAYDVPPLALPPVVHVPSSLRPDDDAAESPPPSSSLLSLSPPSPSSIVVVAIPSSSAPSSPSPLHTFSPSMVSCLFQRFMPPQQCDSMIPYLPARKKMCWLGFTNDIR